MIYAQLNGLEMRINLASPKKLDALISDVDDMGDLRLVNLKLKELPSGK